MEELTFYIILAMSLLFATIIGTAILFLAYSGLFHTVDVGAGNPTVQEVVVAYHFGRGAYRNCGYYFSELASLAPTLKTLGIYYDDPQQVEQDKLRWAVGCIVAKDAEKPNEELLQALKEKGYKLMTLPHVTSAVRTKFPNTTFLSFFFAIYKVYPALANYIQEHKLCAHPYIEIYDGSEIQFMVPLARQIEFYVPESLVEDEEEEEQDEDSEDGRSSSDDVTLEKKTIAKVVEEQPSSSQKLSASVPESSSSSSVAAKSSILRDSFDRDTPVEAVKKTEIKSTESTSVAQPSATDTQPQPGSPVGESGPATEGSSSSEVDSDSYEVVKAGDVSGQN